MKRIASRLPCEHVSQKCVLVCDQRKLEFRSRFGKVLEWDRSRHFKRISDQSANTVDENQILRIVQKMDKFFAFSRYASMRKRRVLEQSCFITNCPRANSALCDRTVTLSVPQLDACSTALSIRSHPASFIRCLRELPAGYRIMVARREGNLS